jgi:UDP-N-acetylmuramate dehydrogenase
MTGDAEFRSGLKQIIAGRVLFDEPMERHTSMGVGGSADAVVLPEGKDELQRLIVFLVERKTPFVALGNGTNMIVRDGGYRGVVVSLRNLRGMKIDSRDADAIRISAESGASLSAILSYCVGESITGMEFCAGIPGSVGGAVKMNAGAYGQEIKDILEHIDLLKNNGEIIEIARDALHFAYRNLALPAGALIVSASFLLRPGNADAVQAEINRIGSLRKMRHPLDYRNSGSIFKNPGVIPPGQLIEKAGLKGMRIGDAQVSEKHGNFIVNLGRARADDVLSLIGLVKKKVLEATGISLETEVVILGEH